ncbi:mannan endo-1,4-beta-mannosidase 7-like [Solanum pennellii]|uniref:mannan endo-1,4-beta-mannosidase n=1 Tax=Solanum pennellii TaxID=28526 RepID=A0ABM1GIC1_SOLPN|nr:mannan endo-1,4-beta-mannosidase 7-like [Solanum pennellii]
MKLYVFFLYFIYFFRNVKANVINDDFIKTKGVHFMLNDSPFYANGFNAYWLMLIGSDPSQRHKVSSVFQDAANHGLTVGRTWAFSDAGYSPLQFSPGFYNEIMFQGLDYAIHEAGKNGIKLILSLVNNYNDFGGKNQYVNWAKSQGQSLTSDDDFYTNSVVKGYFKNHIKAVVTRINSISGIAYKDDPTIMAWELMNEPRCSSDLSGSTVQNWISEMASYTKSIDSNHLVEAGLEGFYGNSDTQKNPNFQVGTDFIANNQIPEIDFATVHSYPDQWLTGQDDEAQLNFLTNWLKVHIEDSQTILKKPIIFAEFGKTTKGPGFTPQQRDIIFNTVYSSIFSSAKGGGAAAGGLFWHVLAEGMDSFKDGYEIILSESSSVSDIIIQQSKRLNKIRKMYARLKNIEKWKKARKLKD